MLIGCLNDDLFQPPAGLYLRFVFFWIYWVTRTNLCMEALHVFLDGENVY